MSEIQVSVTELRKRFDYYLQQVKQGHTLNITVRGKSVGRFIPEPEPEPRDMIGLPAKRRK